MPGVLQRSRTADRARGKKRWQGDAKALGQATWQGWTWVLLGTLGIAVFNVVPTAGSLLLSFCRWDLLGPVEWVGGVNYQQLLSSPLFWQNLVTTAWFVSLTVLLELLLGFGLAYGLFVMGRRWAWLKVLYFLPFVTPMVSMALVWGWFYEPNGGLLNSIAETLHLPAVAWLYQPQTALLAVVAFRLWKQLGYTVLLVGAGLESLPDSVLEAAELDGASGLSRIQHIVLPMLSPVLLVVGVTVVIQAFQAFDVIYLLTQGGPDHQTEVLVYRVFKLAFEQYQVGPASALAYVVFCLILGLTLLQLWLKKTQDGR